MRIVRYIYYTFILVVPFEEVLVDAGIGTGYLTPPKMIAYLLVVVAALQPSLCFRRPPKAFWIFVVYMLVYVSLGISGESRFHMQVISRLVKLFQMMILLWISYNLLRNERVVKGALVALATSTTVLAILQVLGITSRVIAQDRLAAAGGNPNTLSGVLALGLVALVGLAYSRKEMDSKVRWLVWLGFGVLAIALVRSGSRGPVVALAAGLMIFLLKDKSLISKLKTGLIVLVALGSLIWASYQIEAVRVRWEHTFIEGSLSKRETIFPAAWRMFQEKPLSGWGPINNIYEIGARMPREAFFGRDVSKTDPHNLYLAILTETGLLGAVPFFAAVWLCWRAAWRARNSIQGILPMAMLVCLLVINMTDTGANRKLFWVVLAYSLASSSYAPFPLLLKPIVRRDRLVRH